MHSQKHFTTDETYQESRKVCIQSYQNFRKRRAESGKGGQRRMKAYKTRGKNKKETKEEQSVREKKKIMFENNVYNFCLEEFTDAY